MTVAPVPGNGLPLFQARRTALVVIKLQLNCYDKGRREPTESPARGTSVRGTFVLRMHNMRPVAAALPALPFDAVAIVKLVNRVVPSVESANWHIDIHEVRKTLLDGFV